jgi:MoaA/NifB/PqqE/SkfB family radical SAM enzyme
MTDELIKEYELAAIPYIDGGGAITAEIAKLKSWRYFLEINSACNLRCPSCTKGNKEGYEHQTGFMDMDLMGKILDKIKTENPNAIVFTYGNSEPFLHPKLPECIVAIKARGLHPELSTNLNHIQRVDELLNAKPDLILVSLSGWTQEVYVKGHAGGDVEKVKRNMMTLAHANNALPLEQRVKIMVNFHVYNDNGHEVELMREYATNLGIGFFTSFARAISMENAIQYCRSRDPDVTPFEVQEGKPDWNQALPSISDNYVATMERLRINPLKAREMYGKYPVRKVCPVGDMFTFIRHDGKTSLCACVADRRITIGDFLETDAETLSSQRRGHSICGQCQKYRMNLYFHIVDREKWVSP